MSKKNQTFPYDRVYIRTLPGSVRQRTEVEQLEPRAVRLRLLPYIPLLPTRCILLIRWSWLRRAFQAEGNTVKSAHSAAAMKSRKALTGIAGFDEIIGGGLPRGRTTVLAGDPGSGKTIFALQFL